MNVVLYTSLMNAVDDATGTFFPDQRREKEIYVFLLQVGLKSLQFPHVQKARTANSFKNCLIKLQLGTLFDDCVIVVLYCT